jgi:ABC-type phosphate/phosphonate transport system permease subunit
MAIFLSALRGVDEEILRAARLDGANAWALYPHIILPAIKSSFVTVTSRCRDDGVRSRLLVGDAGHVHVRHGLLAESAGRERGERDHRACLFRSDRFAICFLQGGPR